MFEAAEVLKTAVIREWSFLLNTDRISLRQYLFQYVTSRDLPAFVQDRILQIIAIMVKRASVDDNGRDRSSILQEVENLVVNAEPNKVCYRFLPKVIIYFLIIIMLFKILMITKSLALVLKDQRLAFTVINFYM